MPLARRSGCALLSEAAQQIEHFGGNIFVERTIVDRPKRVSELRRFSALLFLGALIQSLISVDCAVGLAAAVAIPVVCEAQYDHPSRPEPRPHQQFLACSSADCRRTRENRPHFKRPHRRPAVSWKQKTRPLVPHPRMARAGRHHRTPVGFHTSPRGLQYCGQPLNRLKLE